MCNFIAAAEYLRVSTEQQKYSLDSQRHCIWEFAENRGFRIVRSYADIGKSGLNIRGRPGLRGLISDILSGDLEFSAVLVYDVSRWGRFQDIDEAAHYEFLCRKAGVPVLYCAEHGVNPVAQSSSILKALRRIMAAEYSRELSGKVFAAQKQSAEAGFKLGSCPFGYRRLLVSPDRTPKRLLGPGEFKPKTGDRVVLVPGPAKEVACIKEVFALAAGGKRPAQIERIAAENGWTREGERPLLRGAIEYMLKNPVYSGEMVWNRHSTKLHSRMKHNPCQEWVRIPGAVEPMVDHVTFLNAQGKSRNKNTPTDDEVLDQLRLVLKQEGALSQRIIEIAWRKGQASAPGVYYRRFGTLENTYRLIGYRPNDSTHGVLGWKRVQFRDRFIRSIVDFAPDHFTIVVPPGRTRFMLGVDGGLCVSVRICYRCSNRPIPTWRLSRVMHEDQFPTLVVLMNENGSGVESTHLLRGVRSNCIHDFKLDSKWFKPAIRVEDPSDLFPALAPFLAT